MKQASDEPTTSTGKRTLMRQNLTKITLCLVLQIQKVNNPVLVTLRIGLYLVAVGQQHLDLDLAGGQE